MEQNKPRYLSESLSKIIIVFLQKLLIHSQIIYWAFLSVVTLSREDHYSRLKPYQFIWTIDELYKYTFKPQFSILREEPNTDVYFEKPNLSR